jgi:hypothetical protein
MTHLQQQLCLQHASGQQPDIQLSALLRAHLYFDAAFMEFCSQAPKGEIYYFNFSTGESIWDHPCDEHFR